MAGETPHFIVFANEKGGTGKSTTAVHIAVALAAQGAQGGGARPRHAPAHARPLSRQSCRDHARGSRLDLPMPAYRDLRPGAGRERRGRDRPAGRRRRMSSSSTRRAATIPYARTAMVRADTLVTPINDSFVDLDLIGQVDAETYQGPPAELLCRADLEQPHRSAPRPTARASTGSCCATACSISRRATCAASARR